MKKTSIFIISILMILGFSTVSLAYTDTEGHWASDVIDELSNKKIINGYSDGTFKPDNSVTRAEFIAIVNRMLGLTTESSKYIPDISRHDWFYSDIRKAVEAGILKGNEEGYVRPNDTITREEAVVILARAFKVTQAPGTGIKFEDRSEVSNWARESVYTFVKYGYINGYYGNLIKPKENVKRAEVLTIIKRIIPNILTEDIYEGIIQGNTLLVDNNIVLRNATISGNLIIKESIISTLKVNNVDVKGNLIIEKTDDIITKIRVSGSVIELYKDKREQSLKYVDKDYGISFAIPARATVIELERNQEIDYKKKDLIAINILQDDNYYLKSVSTIARDEAKKYANLFIEKEEGTIQNAEYVLYDDNDKSQMIVIKRENIVYVLVFSNIVSENVVDNVLSTMKLLKTNKITDYGNVIYKNTALSMKFSYKDFYVSVDDSYNTGVVNDKGAFFKLFIQVNTIIDMDKYSIDEVKYLLKNLASNDGEILESENLKIVNNDAIKFKIRSEEKSICSLYIVVGNNLYNLVFTGDSEAMNEVGDKIFTNIINTIEI